MTYIRAPAQQKKEDLEGLMKAWGDGKLREYLAPDLAKVDVADRVDPTPVPTKPDAADGTPAPAGKETKVRRRKIKKDSYRQQVIRRLIAQKVLRYHTHTRLSPYIYTYTLKHTHTRIHAGTFTNCTYTLTYRNRKTWTA